MINTYKTFLVQDKQLQASIPNTIQFHAYLILSLLGRINYTIVARVLPKTSKGITDLLLPQPPQSLRLLSV